MISDDFVTTAVLLLGAGAILLVLISAGAWLWWRRRSAAEEPEEKKETKPKKAARGKTKKPKSAAPAPKKEKPAPPEDAPTPAEEAPPEPAQPRMPVKPVPDDFAGDKIRILVVDDNLGTRENVSRLLYFENDMEVIGQATNGRQGIEMAQELKPHIVLMDINMPDMDGITATREMSVSTPFSQVIVMSVQAEHHYMKQAMAAGARDFQPKPFTSEELVSCIRRVYNVSRSIYRQLENIEQQQQKPQVAVPKKPTTSTVIEETDTPVIAVFSPKGGIGTSAVATNFAIALQQQTGDVVLMDADLQFGDLLVHLNIRTPRTMSDLIHNNEMDIELIPEILMPHNSGLKLLLSPTQPELADAISPDMVENMIKSLKTLFKAVVVDTGSKLDDKTLKVLNNADYILLLTAPELPAIKSAKLFLEVTKALELDSDRLAVIINQADKPNGVPPTKIEKVLKLDHAYHIPYEPKMSLVINRGIAIIQQSASAPVSQAITRLTGEVWQKAAQYQEMPTP